MGWLTARCYDVLYIMRYYTLCAVWTHILAKLTIKFYNTSDFSVTLRRPTLRSYKYSKLDNTTDDFHQIHSQFRQILPFMRRVFCIPDKWRVFFHARFSRYKIRCRLHTACHHHSPVYRSGDHDTDAAQLLLPSRTELFDRSRHTRNRAAGVLQLHIVPHTCRQGRQ